jgi:hypothetical protein
VPYREDCYTFKGRDAEGGDYWNRAIEAGRGLGEDFMDAVEGGRIRERIRPLPA